MPQQAYTVPCGASHPHGQGDRDDADEGCPFDTNRSFLFINTAFGGDKYKCSRVRWVGWVRSKIMHAQWGGGREGCVRVGECKVG
jgi:hypothetical protein